ncbi:MAG: RNA-directed polymerase [Myxococcaceae bacterium]|nr:RNA-directed polymerase [Myxococcaceae bacterium]
MMETSGSASISTKLDRIATLAKQAPEMAFTTLAHHIDLDWLREAYRRTRKDGATGIDGQTATEYATNLEGNLRSLLERAKSGMYRAPPVRRIHIPKGDGTQTRPIGVPTFEDKVLQRAVAMVLEAIYEQDFLDCSYGFRPRRSAHQAVERVQNETTRIAGGWVLEVDIAKFFDTLDHAHLRELLRRRVRDGVLLRLIGKWLNAGVMEAGGLSYPDAGTPQGGVISPLLANVYLHEVLDTWFERDVKPRLQGQAFLVRYADDAVMLFSREDDARRVMDVLPKRFAKYGLTLHPEKTRLVEFQRPNRRRPPKDGDGGGQPGTFDLLGFTHYWGLSRKGRWIVKQRTARDRFNRAVKRIAAWCKLHRHQQLRSQWQILASKVRGHYGYFGITGNFVALERFRDRVTDVWRRWLGRRSSSRVQMSFERMDRLLERYPLPAPRIMRSNWTPRT